MKERRKESSSSISTPLAGGELLRFIPPLFNHLAQELRAFKNKASLKTWSLALNKKSPTTLKNLSRGELNLEAPQRSKNGDGVDGHRRHLWWRHSQPASPPRRAMAACRLLRRPLATSTVRRDHTAACLTLAKPRLDLDARGGSALPVRLSMPRREHGRCQATRGKGRREAAQILGDDLRKAGALGTCEGDLPWEEADGHRRGGWASRRRSGRGEPWHLKPCHHRPGARSRARNLLPLHQLPLLIRMGRILPPSPPLPPHTHRCRPLPALPEQRRMVRSRYRAWRPTSESCILDTAGGGVV